MTRNRPGIAEIYTVQMGNKNSLEVILDGYADYISLYSMYSYRDDKNKERRYIDDDCKQYIFARVLKAIRQFNPNYHA